MIGPELERLIQLLARLPGLGPRSARRAALHLIDKRDAVMVPLALLFSITVLYLQGKSANLLSIGAVDFGIVALTLPQLT